MKTKKTFMLLVLGLLLFALPLNASALEPKLLWERKIPFEFDDIKMSAQSGDVIVYSQSERQIIMYDKNGKEVFHWGPRIDRQPMSADISDDGSVVLYETTYVEDYLVKRNRGGEWDKRIHYVTRKGKELWNKEIGGAALLSPDGKMVGVFESAGEGQDLTMYDSQGKYMWTFPTPVVDNILFSPDSQYVGVKYGGFSLIDKSGNVLCEKTDIGVSRATISDMARYVCLSDENDVSKVYDKQGNLVFEDDAYLTDDGNRLFARYTNKMVLLSLPDKSVIKEYPSWRGFISRDGRYLVTRGVTNRDNTLVLDTLDQVEREIPTGRHTNFMNTNDGKFMAVVTDNNKILFYQLY